MTLDIRQLQTTVMLPGPQRYAYFVERVVDGGVVWSLFRQGWALAKKDDGTMVFPLWPAREFALLCADHEWTGYAPVSFALDELLDDLLPQLEGDGIATGVFYTPGARDVMPGGRPAAPRPARRTSPARARRSALSRRGRDRRF